MDKNNNVAKWDDWYKELDPNSPSAYKYSNTETYKIAADFLSDCETIEDWGVGAGGFLNYCPKAVGVDGSNTPFATKKYVDLTTYVTNVEGVNLRHVLEHNYAWDKILNNLLKSASKKIALTFFIPLSNSETTELAHNLKHGVDVPDLSISETKFNEILNSYELKNVEKITLNTNTGYGVEIVFLIEK